MEYPITKLIIVPGHASFKASIGLPLPKDFIEDEYWALQPFQKGEPPYYVEHIKRALEVADASTLIVFSGGRTREESGREWSEAKTYNEIAKTLPHYGTSRIELEEYARDSFQNLDYSAKLFTHLLGHPPRSITVVGWKFKEERNRFHAQTLGIDPSRFEYIGVNDPSANAYDEAIEGEKAILQKFHDNPRGDQGVLSEKRKQRDPWEDGEPSYA